MSSVYSSFDEYGLRYFVRHLLNRKRWKNLKKLLTDLAFLETKCMAGMGYELGVELRQAIKCWPSDSIGTHDVALLQAISHQLDQNLWYLVDFPELTFQALYNGLISSPVEGALKWALSARAFREATDNQPWLEELCHQHTPLLRYRMSLGNVKMSIECAISGDGSTGIIAGLWGDLALYNLHEGRVHSQLSQMGLLYRISCNLNRTGSYALLNYRNLFKYKQPGIGTWDGRSDLITLIESQDDFAKVVLASDEDRIAAWMATGEIWIFSKTVPDHVLKVQTKVGPKNGSLAFGAGWDFLIAAAENEIVGIIRTSDGEVVACITVASTKFVDCSASDHPFRIIAVTDERQLFLFEGKSIFIGDYPQLVKKRIAHEKAVSRCAISNDGSRVITGSSDGIVKVWEWGRDKPITQLKHRESVLAVACSDDGNVILTLDNVGLQVWDVPSDISTADKKQRFSTTGQCSVDLSGSYAAFSDQDGHSIFGIPIKAHLKWFPSNTKDTFEFAS